MKRISVYLGGALIAVSSIGWYALSDNDLFVGIQRSIATFTEVFRKISLQYVDDVDPEAIVEAGVERMLETLDPYSEFIPPGEDDDVEMLATGKYTGFGITVERLDSSLVVSNVRTGHPAHRAGLRIGDRLLFIDSVRVDTLAPGDLRPHTRGSAGTTATVRILRDGRSDTIVLRVLRSEVAVQNIAHAERRADGLAYVKVVRFSRQTGGDVRNAIAELKRQGPLRGLVLDLRDNPGGLLDAAVELCGVFLPRGTTVVTTRGREAQDSRTYRVANDPMEPSLPLAVLINGGSASASEIVAGAIQDHDRGIILGRRSFGKGLVQTVLDLPYEASMKLTTARYYTPSGRCIQRIDHSRVLRRTASRADTVRKFATASGRIVHELDGIDPDSTIADTVFPAPVQHLLDRSVLFRFGSRYTASWTELPTAFGVDAATVDAFFKFVATQPAERRSPVLGSLAASKAAAVKAGLSAATIKAMETTERQAEREVERTLRQHEPLLRELLEQEIRSRFSDEGVRIARSLTFDPVLRAASQILGSTRYSTFLAPQTRNEH